MVRTVELAQMLGNFQHQPDAAVLGFQRVQDRRQMVFELHVDDRADDLSDFSDCVGCGHIVLVTETKALRRRR